MALKNDLVSALNLAHDTVWDEFRNEKKKALSYGLAPSSAARWRRPGEPALTYGVMSPNSMSLMGAAVHAALPTLSAGQAIVRFNFIHQKPKISYDPGKGPIEIELGDLMVIRQHFAFGKRTPQGRAFILQAKAKKKPETGKLSANDLKQLQLYQNWHFGFSFPHGEFGPPASGGNWDFSTGNQNPKEHTGVYGVVLNDERMSASAALGKFPDKCVWAVGLPANLKRNASSVPGKQSLGDVMAQLLEGGFGREWTSAVPARDDHWSEFVQLVLASVELKNSIAALRRIGKSVGRTGDLVSYMSALPGVAQLLDRWPDSDVPHPYTSTQGYWYFEGAELLRRWAASLGDDEFPTQPPERPAVPEKPRPGGMSHLYIATVGEAPLSAPDIEQTENR